MPRAPAHGRSLRLRGNPDQGLGCAPVLWLLGGPTRRTGAGTLWQGTAFSGRTIRSVAHPCCFPLRFACCSYQKAYSHTSWLFSWTSNPTVPLPYMFSGQMGTQITPCFQLGTIWLSQSSCSHPLCYILCKGQTFSPFGCPSP